MTFGPPPSPFTQSQRVAVERRRRRTKVWVSIVAGLAVVACAGVWFTWGGLPGDNKDDAVGGQAAPRQAPDEVRETVEQPPKDRSGHLGTSLIDALPPGKNLVMPGTWATSKVLVKGMNSTLEGIKAGTDEEAWHYRLPGLICGTTRHVTTDGRTAILFRSSKGEDAPCDRLALFSLNRGEKLWQVTVPTPKSGHSFSDPNVTLTRGVVATAWGAGSAAYDMAEGKRIWVHKRTAKCRDGGFAGGLGLLLRRDCVNEAEKWGNSRYQVQEIDPQTGKSKWTYDVADGVNLVYLASSEPPVVAVAAGDAGLTDLISLDGKGKYRATIRLEGGNYEVDCSADLVNESSVEDCAHVVVGRKQAFITSGERVEGINHTSNWIVSFDLGTGRTDLKFESGQDQMIYPIRMSGDQVLAFKRSTDNFAPSSVVSLDPKTGVITPYYYFNVPAEANFMDPKLDDIVFEHGRIYFAARELQGVSKGGEAARLWGAVGIESVSVRRPSS
ncbi:PQQ-binding-like beta-propeller repeat protein [Streptomyces sp. NPDC059916]|uniref:outer membrane protein assembly factor BamB family protein n=1 Tax=Streptomyces sp. NPDC059916 TaxID=3347001 RepID=UPI0036D10677